MPSADLPSDVLRMTGTPQALDAAATLRSLSAAAARAAIIAAEAGEASSAYLMFLSIKDESRCIVYTIRSVASGMPGCYSHQ